MINPLWVEWRKAKTHHLVMIDRYFEAISVNGQKWLDKMTAYHRRELAALEASKPPRLVDR